MERSADTEIEVLDDELEVLSGTQIDPDTPFESSESELSADVADHARPGPKGGRPRKDGIKPGIVEAFAHQPIPTPRIRTFKSDSTAPNASSKSAWNYWNSLPNWAKERIVAYVYRDHPILLDPEDSMDGSRPTQFKYIDKIIGTQPVQDDADLLNRYGCGSYRVTLTDSAPKKKDDRPVCTVWVVNIGGSNYRSNPPTDNRIDDIEQIDLDHPANKSYVAYLRGQGKLPDQINSKQQESEMANVQLIEKLVDKVTEDRDRQPKPQQLDEASKRAFDISAKLTESAIETMKSVNEYAAKERDKIDSARPAVPVAVAPAPTADPISTAIQLIEAIQKMSGGNQGNSVEVLELRNQLNQFLQNQIASQQKQIEMLMEAKVTTPAAAASSPFSSMKEGLESLREMKAVVDDFRGSATEEAGEGATEAIADAAPKWLKPFLPLAPLAGQVLAAFLASRQQPQVPYIPQGYPSGPMPGYVPPQQINAPMPMPMQPGMPSAPTVAIDNPNNLPGPALEVLSSIKDSLAFHMDYEMSGSEFAGWYARQFGEPKYREISGLGTDNIMQLLTLYPPTARVIQGQKPEYVTDFVSEFCHPTLEDDGEGEDGGVKQPSA